MIILNIQQVQDSSVNTMRLSIALFRNSIFNSNPEKKMQYMFMSTIKT